MRSSLDSSFTALIEFTKRPIPGDHFGVKDVLFDVTASCMEGILKSYESCELLRREGQRHYFTFVCRYQNAFDFHGSWHLNFHSYSHGNVMNLSRDTGKLMEASKFKLQHWIAPLGNKQLKAKCVTNKVSDILSAYHLMSNELEAMRKDLIIKEEQLRSCSRCSALEKDLAASRKKLSINETRIRSIAQILTSRFSTTEDVEENSDNESSVTKAYNMVSQILMCDIESIEQNPESLEGLREVSELSENAGDNKDAPNKVDEIGKKTKRQVTPKKKLSSKSKFTSPVLGKNKYGSNIHTDSIGKPVDQEEIKYKNDYDDDTICIPPSPTCNVNSNKNTFLSTDALLLNKISPRKVGGEKRKAGVWQLKTINKIDSDSCSLSKQGKRFKQAQLLLKCSPEITDVSSLSQFNGGIRPSQASTQKSTKNTSEDFALPKGEPPSKSQSSCRAVERNEDVIMDSPPNSRSINSSNRFQKRLSSNSRPGSVKTKEVTFNSTKDYNAAMSKDADCQENISDSDAQNDGFSKKLASSPKFKYRQQPVRKKEERMKLEGWDCENCRKYYEVAGGCGNHEQEHKEHMNRCSRHRDKYPVYPKTPPGFWDAEFPNTMEYNMLNETHADVLASKKDDSKSLKRKQ